MKSSNGIASMQDIEISLKQNHPGEIAKAVTAIANSQTNIEGFCEIDGKFHCVTSDPKAAHKALESAGFAPFETDVLVFSGEDKPGYLANVLRKVAEQEVNVIASYTLTNTRIALAVDQPARVKEILEGFATATTRQR